MHVPSNKYWQPKQQHRKLFFWFRQWWVVGRLKVSSEIVCFPWHCTGPVCHRHRVEIGFSSSKIPEELQKIFREAGGGPVNMLTIFARPIYSSSLNMPAAAAATKKCISIVSSNITAIVPLIFLHWTITTGNWTQEVKWVSHHRQFILFSQRMRLLWCNLNLYHLSSDELNQLAEFDTSYSSIVHLRSVHAVIYGHVVYLQDFIVILTICFPMFVFPLS